MIKRVFSILLLLSILLASCCAEVQSPPPSPPPSPGCSSDVISFTLLADVNLSDDIKNAVEESLGEWDEKTGYCVGYTVVYKDMTGEEEDVSKFSNTYKFFVRNPGTGLLGWTSWMSHKNSAIIFIKPDLDMVTFKATMLHELGHAFDLHFGEDTHYTGEFKSIMHPAIGNTDKLECPELTAFCDKYNCKVVCENIKINVSYLQSHKSLENVCETTMMELTP